MMHQYQYGIHYILEGVVELGGLLRKGLHFPHRKVYIGLWLGSPILPNSPCGKGDVVPAILSVRASHNELHTELSMTSKV